MFGTSPFRNIYSLIFLSKKMILSDILCTASIVHAFRHCTKQKTVPKGGSKRRLAQKGGRRRETTDTRRNCQETRGAAGQSGRLARASESQARGGALSSLAHIAVAR